MNLMIIFITNIIIHIKNIKLGNQCYKITTLK